MQERKRLRLQTNEISFLIRCSISKIYICPVDWGPVDPNVHKKILMVPRINCTII